MNVSSLALTFALSAGICAAADAAEITIKPVTIPEMKAVYGQIQPRISVAARARLSGTVADLRVTEGDIVKAGDVIAEIKDDKLDFQIKAIDAQLLGLQASLKDARAELDRAERLVRSGATSTQRFDQLRTQTDVITNQIGTAEAQRSVIVQQSAEGAVIAPSDGRVVSVPATKDAVAMAGETIAEIASGGFFLRLAVPERHAQDLRQGSPIRIDAAGTPLTGTLAKIYPLIDGGRVTADVEVENLDTQFVGGRVLVELPVGQRQAILVPADAITTHAGVDFVTVKETDGTVQRAVLAGGPVDSEGNPAVEILSGLVEGDILVTP
ncbi:efflux RND transporter periplasmic adaptor subunit [Rhizobium sp. AG855]|uniref:efflux RND transporter periplasmic adaptor subunit n=1 Tax=Rhizobium sp. AG855 TaxID=2183898 RepID=UPI000E746830|nr:efflux RND transporter periplasmic adaptor subunit [Rhizobium sp. AG855]RKE83457.1 RND family efflux transporter MFP subunit [Rhizobium sp. AG855]